MAKTGVARGSLRGPQGPAGSSAPATTDASALTSGLLAPERLPAVSNPVRVGTAGSLLLVDAARSVGGTISNIAVTGALSVQGMTNPTDGQILRYRFRADGADRTVTFVGTASGRPTIVPSTGLTLGPYTIPRGRILIAALEYCGDRRTPTDAAAPAWVLTAATVSG